MTSCKVDNEGPGPIAPLDENDAGISLDPPPFTPIAQAFADTSTGFLANFDIAYSALRLEQGLDLAGLLGDDGGDGGGSVASIFSAPAPVITQGPIAPGGPTPTTTYALTIVVRNAATGGAIGGAAVRIWQLVGVDAPQQTNSAGSTTFVVGPFGVVNIFVDVDGYAPGRVTTPVVADTTVEIGLLPSSLDTTGVGTAAAADLAQLEAQLIDIRARALSLLTYTGANPKP